MTTTQQRKRPGAAAWIIAILLVFGVGGGGCALILNAAHHDQQQTQGCAAAVDAWQAAGVDDASTGRAALDACTRADWDTFTRIDGIALSNADACLRYGSDNGSKACR